MDGWREGGDGEKESGRKRRKRQKGRGERTGTDAGSAGERGSGDDARAWG